MFWDRDRAQYNLVMGGVSGMPVDERLPDILHEHMIADAVRQTTLIGRQEIWPVHQATADRGSILRIGVEGTPYLPDGGRASDNGQLIQALSNCAQRAGRSVASPDEARDILNLKPEP